MSKRSIWRLISVLVICGICAYFFLPLHKIRLGLDLRGGVRFDLEVQSHEALQADFRDTRDRLVDRLKEKGIFAPSVKIQDKAIRVEGYNADQKGIVDKVIKTFAGYETAFDDKGVSLSHSSYMADSLKKEAGQRALQIIENRVNQFGMTEPEITASGEDGSRIVVELPGISDAEKDRIRDLLSTPGRLEQRLVAKNDPSGGAGFATREEVLAHFNGQLPLGTELLPEMEGERDIRRSGDQTVIKGKREEKVKRWFLFEEKVYVDGADVVTAYPSVDQTTNRNEIAYTLNGKGADAFLTLSRIASEEKRLIGILLDRKVVSVLHCDQPIPGGSVRITGQFTPEAAEDFARKLKSGAMRASIKFLEEKTVGPTLGADSIRTGVLASVIGYAFIIIFMIIYYKWSGVNALIALTVNAIVMMGLLGSFRAVFTLPGIAGFILSLGMAVDANILIFERIREELGLGKSVPAAIHAGFDRVFWTIVDSHVTQLFSALLLYSFGTGPVKGFAVTLTVGVVASLFTSIYISRYIYDWLLEREPGKKTLSI